MKKVGCISCLILLFSCSKAPMLEEAPSMVGTWVHYSAVDAWEKVIINADGTGKVEWYTNSKLHKETKEKSWFVEGNKLYLGKVTFSLQPYDIQQFPLQSSATVIEGYDTLTLSSRYCQMNGLYFVEKG